jgi:hypothetical protein
MGAGVILPPALVCVTPLVQIPRLGTLPSIARHRPSRGIAGVVALKNMTGVAGAGSFPARQAFAPGTGVSAGKIDPRKGQ